VNYYNEWDAYRAEWLRNLIRDGQIPDGKVDERDIAEVKAKDLDGFTQYHWFAGIAGWAQALKLANWLPDVPAWTGSCPCQPLSCAGKREGEKDVRHLWPVFYRLICERRPPVVFGEQTASGDGPEWVAGVRLDLEAAGYRVGIANLPAAGVGAPHPRARLWWVGDASGAELARRTVEPAREERATLTGGSGSSRLDHAQDEDGRSDRCDAAGGSRSGRTQLGRAGIIPCGLGDSDSERFKREPVCVQRGGSREAGIEAPRTSQSDKRYCPACDGCYPESSWQWSDGRCPDCGMADTTSPRAVAAQQPGCGDGPERQGFWSSYEVLYRNEPKHGLVPCRAEPGVFPLVDGFPTRVEQVSAYGDAICPEIAAQFVKAFMETGGSYA
jgi:DNA (cytosine-5)-methyltransferase 1